MAYSASCDRSTKPLVTLPPARLLCGQGMERGWWDSGLIPLKGQKGVSGGLGYAQEMGDLPGVTAPSLSSGLGICEMVGVGPLRACACVCVCRRQYLSSDVLVSTAAGLWASQGWEWGQLGCSLVPGRDSAQAPVAASPCSSQHLPPS